MKNTTVSKAESIQTWQKLRTPERKFRKTGIIMPQIQKTEGHYGHLVRVAAKGSSDTFQNLGEFNHCKKRFKK